MNHEDSSIVLVKWQSRVWEHVVSLFGCDRLREMSMRSSFQQIPLKHEEHALRAERPGLLRLGIRPHPAIARRFSGASGYWLKAFLALVILGPVSCSLCVA